MTLLYLGPPSNLLKYLEFFGSVDTTTDKLNIDQVKKYDWIISYGYRHIIKQDIIDAARNPIINLHISYLPWNRGASPNYFSWKHNTPKGVTIHKIDSGVDTGDIYIQKQIEFTGEETLAESYNKLKIEIEALFIYSFDSIIKNRILPYKQIGRGTTNYIKDIPNSIDWNTKANKI